MAHEATLVFNPILGFLVEGSGGGDGPSRRRKPGRLDFYVF